jgi:hypothetical protein
VNADFEQLNDEMDAILNNENNDDAEIAQVDESKQFDDEMTDNLTNDNDMDAMLNAFTEDIPIKPHKPANIAEKEGFVYFSGFLARKTNSTNHYVRDNNVLEDGHFVQSKWLDMMNTGGLSYPSKDLSKDVYIMEAYFRQFHGQSKDQLNREPQVVKRLATDIHMAMPQYKYELIKKCVLSRTIFRMRMINTNLAHVESAASKKKRIEHMY